MKGTRLQPKRRRGAGWLKKLCMLAAFAGALLFSGCGAEEEQKEEGDYGYIIEESQENIFDENTDVFGIGFVTMDGYLYFNNGSFFRIRLEEPDFKNKEIFCPMDKLPLGSKESIRSFTVDKKENLYFVADTYEKSGIAVYKCTRDGEEIYRVPFDDEELFVKYSTDGSAIAVGDKGDTYVVSRTSILRIDMDGNPAGKIRLEESAAGQFVNKYLIKTSDGTIWFFVDDHSTFSRAAYRLIEGNSFRLEPAEDLAQNGIVELHAGLEGLLVEGDDGVLYRYDVKNGVSEKMLRWEDCDLYVDDIKTVIQATKDRLLIFPSAEGSWDNTEQECVILARVPAEELPEKEQVVLASLFPTQFLRKTVVNFNRQSSRYHVSVATYGASAFEDNEGAYAQLDAAIVSQGGPDLLDLTEMDVSKYVDADALDDLAAYMGEDSSVKKEDYIANVLEGYTIGGKLVTIPKYFSFSYLLAADERIWELEDYSMESFIALGEKYPDMNILPKMRREAGFLLERFCAEYYLKKYVDQEKGTCDFNSEGFRSLLEWVRDQCRQANGTDESLLETCFAYNFSDHQKNMIETGGYGILLGYPSADKKGCFPVRIIDSIGILANAEHKEGAWAFLQFYLGEQKADSYGFPTYRESMDEMEEEALTPIYDTDEHGNTIMDTETGEPLERPKSTYYSKEEYVEIYAMKQSDADVLRAALAGIDFTPRSTIEQSIIAIVAEEAEGFLSGAKTVEETADIIQNRVLLLIQESR